MWDKSRPTRRSITSVSLISLISLITVLCGRYCSVLAVENCSILLSSCLAYMGPNFAILPLLSPTPYKLFIVFLLHSTSPSLSPIISFSHTLYPIPYVAFSQHIPSPHSLLPHWDNHIFSSSLWDNVCTDSRELSIASRSCFGLLIFWLLAFYYYYFFFLFYPTNLQAPYLLPHSLIFLFTFPYTSSPPFIYCNCAFPLT